LFKVSGTISVPIVRAVMSHNCPDDGARDGGFNKMTQLIACEDFINVNCCEDITSYNNITFLLEKHRDHIA
jgi:hypothetical protein